jgi:nucleoside-diphosphate-sugar epimerase
VSESLDPLGVEAADIVLGDVVDERVLSRAVDGCAAAVHAAGIFSLDPRRAEDMQRTNAQATELVLNSAAERGLDPVVHVQQRWR